jgi:hypothetical protein
MQEMTEHKVNAERFQWWNDSRHTLNKGLVVGGLIVIIACALIFAFVLPPSDDIPQINFYFFLLALIVYTVYLAIVNLLFLIVEMLDRVYSVNNSLRVRMTLFNYFYWILIFVPFIYPAFLLTMFYLH